MLRDEAYLQDIVIACRKVAAFIDGIDQEAFEQQEVLQQAVIRMIEIIGEAARNLSAALKDSHPEIPWREIVNMRNILTHMYWRVDVEKVWDTARNDLPDVIARLEPHLGQGST